MMDSSNYTNRNRIIRFGHRFDPEETGSIETHLAQLDGINHYHFEEASLSVSYRFPVLTLGVVLKQVNASVRKTPFSPGHRLWYAIIAFMENNERDSQLMPRGWQRRIEDISAYYFQRRRESNTYVSRQSWRDYNK